MTDLRAAFLTLDADSASARVRIVDHLDGLRVLGIRGALLPLPRGLLARRRLLAGLGEHDVVVLHRVLLGELTLVPLRRHRAGLVLDLDDAIHRRPFRARTSLRLRHKFERTVRVADLVVVGNEHLREELRRRHPRVRLLPPASPLPRVDPGPPREEETVRLVWTGSRHTLPFLEDLALVLEQVAREHPGLVLEVVADLPPRLGSRIPVRFTPWSLAAEEEVLRRADLGLYPLRGDPWSRGKCAYKLRRYMMFGLPSLASPHGAGPEVLRPPEAGLVAESPEEWRAALERLIGDGSLRRRMGRRALALALGRDSLGDRTRSLARILREAAAVGRLRANHFRLARKRVV